MEKLLTYARSLAVINDQSVYVCVSFDRQRCSLGAGQWLMVFSKQNRTPHIYRWMNLHGRGWVYWRGFGRSISADFLATGLVGHNGSFYYQSLNGRLLAKLTVNKLGRVSLKRI